MQIMPTSTTHGLDGLLASNGNTSVQAYGTTSFSQMFAKHTEASPAEVTPVISTEALASQAEKNTTSPFDATTTAPYGESQSATGVAGVRLTDKELKQIRDNLAKQGADQDTLNKVAALFGNPLGVTVESLIKALAGQQAARVNEGDLGRIQSLANTLDPSGKLATSLLDNIRNGRTGQAWNDFSQALQQADPSAVFSIDKNEVLSFGKALGLGAGTLNALDKTFMGQDGGQFSPQGLQRLFVPAQQEMIGRAASQEKLAQQLETALAPVIRQAQKRLADEESAASKQSRQVQHSKTLIEDSMTQSGLARQGVGPNAADAADQVGNAGSARLGKGQSSPLNGVGEASLASVHGINANQQKDPHNGLFGDHSGQSKDGQSLDKRQGRNGDLHAATGKTETTDKPASPWDALIQRLSAQGLASATPTAPTAQGQAAAQVLQNPGVLPQQRSRMAEQVLAQVEQGVLTGFRDGSKTLQLQLNPAELGAMTILLTTRNGEVSATLRPERGETAVMLAQQTDQLKATLEQQGVKVDKVEVQTQLKDNQNSNSSWQGLDQHNASQEQKARSDELERIRRLTRMGRISDSAVELARSARMAPTAMTANVDGLHLVA